MELPSCQISVKPPPIKYELGQLNIIPLYYCVKKEKNKAKKIFTISEDTEREVFVDDDAEAEVGGGESAASADRELVGKLSKLRLLTFGLEWEPFDGLCDLFGAAAADEDCCEPLPPAPLLRAPTVLARARLVPPGEFGGASELSAASTNVPLMTGAEAQDFRESPTPGPINVTESKS